MHIDAKGIRRDALAVKGTDAADFAEKMPGSHGVKLILGLQRISGGCASGTSRLVRWSWSPA